MTSRCDCCPCRGCKCGRRRDAAVLGRRLINHQAVPVLDARRCSVVYIKSTAVASRSASFAGAAKPKWEMRFDLTRCAAHLSVVNAYFVDRSPGPREIPLLLLPLLSGIQHLQRRLAQLNAAVQGSKRFFCGTLNAETLPLSYQTTPQFIRTPSLHPLPPLTHTARVLPAGRW